MNEEGNADDFFSDSLRDETSGTFYVNGPEELPNISVPPGLVEEPRDTIRDTEDFARQDASHEHVSSETLCAF